MDLYAQLKIKKHQSKLAAVEMQCKKKMHEIHDAYKMVRLSILMISRSKRIPYDCCKWCIHASVLLSSRGSAT